jgi:hypothetical protein
MTKIFFYVKRVDLDPQQLHKARGAQHSTPILMRQIDVRFRPPGFLIASATRKS